MKKIKGLLIYLCLHAICSCNYQKGNSINLGLFDLSKDDKHILFSVYNKGKSSIYQMDTNGKNLKELIPSANNNSYLNPKYSPDGKKIVYISVSADSSQTHSVYIANTDGTDQRKIIVSKQVITEVSFSECEQKIYFIKNNEFSHFSPLSQSQPHGADIYSIDLLSNKIQKITQLNAYGLFRISEYHCDDLLTNMSMESRGGIIMFPKNKPNELQYINPINPPRKDFSLFNTPQYSNKYNMLAFMVPYEIYAMDMRARDAKLVFKSSGNLIDDFCFFNEKKAILYTIQGEMSFNIVNLDGTVIKSIPILLNSEQND